MVATGEYAIMSWKFWVESKDICRHYPELALSTRALTQYVKEI